jgi:hypothetical protein
MKTKSHRKRLSVKPIAPSPLVDRCGVVYESAAFTNPLVKQGYAPMVHYRVYVIGLI